MILQRVESGGSDFSKGKQVISPSCFEQEDIENYDYRQAGTQSGEAKIFARYQMQQQEYGYVQAHYAPKTVR